MHVHQHLILISGIMGEMYSCEKSSLFFILLRGLHLHVVHDLRVAFPFSRDTYYHASIRMWLEMLMQNLCLGNIGLAFTSIAFINSYKDYYEESIEFLLMSCTHKEKDDW